MTFDEAFASVLNHANLPHLGSDEGSQRRSVSFAIKTGSVENVDELMEDLFASANVIAAELSQIQSDEARHLRLRAAYAISCTLADAVWFSQVSDAIPRFHRHLPALAHALSQLLAGDVSDLLESFEPPAERSRR